MKKSQRSARKYVVDLDCGHVQEHTFMIDWAKYLEPRKGALVYCDVCQATVQVVSCRVFLQTGICED